MNDPSKNKIKGPASYFPSIETKYGKPIDHWIKLVKARKDETHGQRVSWLKEQHGLGHGHANAIVAYVMTQEK